MNAQKPTTVLIDNIPYFSAEEMHKYIPKHFKGCPRARTIVENKKLQENDYIFAYIKDDPAGVLGLKLVAVATA